MWKVSTARNKVIHRQQVAYTTPASHSELLDTDPYDRSAQAEARDVLNKLDVLPDERLRTITSMKARGLSNVAVGKELGLSNQYVSTMLNNLWEELNHARV